MTSWLILFLLGSYLLGSVPTGLVLSRLFSRQDIRREGSGNIGATNVTRVLGKKLGALTFAGDMLKGFLPVTAGLLVFRPVLAGAGLQAAVCAFGLAAFLGHLYPVYLKFKGGKGVATAFGIFLFLNPAAAVIVLLVFIGVVYKWRYVSLGSITACASMPLVLLVIACFFKPVYLHTVVLSVIIAALILVKHRSNLQRLRSGTENRVGGK